MSRWLSTHGIGALRDSKNSFRIIVKEGSACVRPSDPEELTGLIHFNIPCPSYDSNFRTVSVNFSTEFARVQSVAIFSGNNEWFRKGELQKTTSFNLDIRSSTKIPSSVGIAVSVGIKFDHGRSAIYFQSVALEILVDSIPPTSENIIPQDKNYPVQIWCGSRPNYGSLLLSSSKTTDPIDFHELRTTPFESHEKAPTLSPTFVERGLRRNIESLTDIPILPLDSLLHNNPSISLTRWETHTERYTMLPHELYTPDKTHPYKGIWAAGYGTSEGTIFEFFLFQQPYEHRLQIIKITGDINVPRGKCSVFANLPTPSPWSGNFTVCAHQQVRSVGGDPMWQNVQLKFLNFSVAYVNEIRFTRVPVTECVSLV